MKNLKHVWTVLCKKSVIDNETNNLSLYEVLERLQVKIGQRAKGKVPLSLVIPFDFEVISFWVRSNYNGKTHIKAETRLQVYDPAGSVIGEMKRPFEVLPEIRRMRIRLRSPNMNITTPGVYRFVISAKEVNENEFEVMAEMPLEIEMVSEIKIEGNQQAKN